MKCGSLFSGIGGFDLAARRVGWTTAWHSEVDPFACKVFAHHFPHSLPLGDVTKVTDAEPVDCLTAGFPCQDLSVAGKRAGLGGARSGLFWEVIRIAEWVRPRWLCLENVPGLFSSPSAHPGRDFEIVLTALDGLGYGVAWRVLDAQFFGLAQRRERVFLVGHLGAPCPPEILFEPESVLGDFTARGEAWEGTTGSVAACLNSGGNRGGFRTEPGAHVVIANALTARDGKGADPSRSVGTLVVNGDAHSGFRDEHGTPIVMALQTDATPKAGTVAFTLKQPSRSGGGQPAAVLAVRPRRLTPRECERLQGFPDDWTLIDGAADSNRYRALGNAVAVPVVEWFLRRLQGFSWLSERTGPSMTPETEERP